MDELRKKRFTDTLTGPYDHQTFILFLKELLNDVQIVNPDRLIQPYNTFSVAISGYYHIGNFTGKNGSKIALFSVELKNNKNLENARSMQRNFVKNLLEESGFQGALVAFYTKEEPDKWRLSFVRLDYEFSQGKISKKLTPAKRYSFLVGKGEPCHTAQQQLFPIFGNENENPSIDDLESAFSVEAVTDDFFNQYKEKYLQLKDVLDNNDSFNAEAESRGFTSEQFAKKLMGQIVFLYFVQKKGWLGVGAFPPVLTPTEYKNAFYSRGQKPKQLMPVVYSLGADGNYHRNGKAIINLSGEDQVALSKIVRGNPWGSGPKDFMRQLFDIAEQRNKNYFDDFLEPLFYTGLNQNRGENAYFVPLNCRIPFLNGGLFEQLDGYDWEHNDFSIPNEIFSNRETKGDREADGILDIFDRYNFTIAEDEPMEREIAIDPEMLGKVFENLLDVKDRKSKGAFYTPREIVHFMCQETLINFLANKTGIPDEDIRKFILYGEYFYDEDTRKTIYVKGENGAKGHMEYDKNKDLEIPETIFSFKKNVNRLQELDDLLDNVKVADLAVGSGAFPLGMLTEIVKARTTITSYLAIEKNSFDRGLLYANRSPYRLKRAAIKNSIFACDIEPSATDITKLRLWLSLVIDDQIMDYQDEERGYDTKPRELPNLDCNIICGNSLMDEFGGIQLITENSVLRNESHNRQGDMFDEQISVQLQKLIDLQSKLYDEKDHVEKDILKEEIQDIYDQIILTQINANPDLVDEYFKTVNQPSKPFILWQLYFPKVFRDNGGFDIVIGNPPYIDSEEMTKSMPELREVYSKRYECARGNWDLYIPFWEKGFGLLSQRGSMALITPNKWLSIKYGAALRAFLMKYIFCICDYSNFYAFNSADVSTAVVMASKMEVDQIIAMKFNSKYEITAKNTVTKSDILEFDNLGMCLSENFSTLNKLLMHKKLEDEFNISGAATVSETYEIANCVLDNGSDNVDEAKYLKFVNTGLIDKFMTKWGIDNMTYVKKKYMYPVVDKKKLNDLYPRRYRQGVTPKLITTGIRYFEVFGDLEGKYMAAKSTEIITPKSNTNITLKSLLSILNSSVVYYFLKEAYGGMAMGGGITYSPNNLGKIPIPHITAENIKELENFSDEFSKEFNDDKQDILDIYIYNLYKLDDKDIDNIERFKTVNKKKNSSKGGNS